ncbi:CLUMA_CG000669, isoform A [Clunio marinus]|uniref:CLUMA_CG000669, isoform A n=1 Tax=Clunio marinus TaxID=568069 RepID=A0A1J1HKS7_9DIPT|nr:CLUMA_CG000669, isoform A [Clunio marinus]
MVSRNFLVVFVISVVLHHAIALNEKVDKSEVKDEKKVAKRGVLHYSTHGHIHPAVVSASHYHLPPAIAKYPLIQKPIFPVPVAPPVIAPAVHAVHPHYRLVPGGASVTSFNVNYPRYPLLARPLAPFIPKPVIPAVHHPAACGAHFHPTFVAPKPVVPVAVPYPGIHRHPKYPIVFQKPVVGGFFPPQYVPLATPNPTFIPVAVPANPQPALPPIAVNPGTQHNMNPFAVNPGTQHNMNPFAVNPGTQHNMNPSSQFPQSQFPMPTQPTLQIPTMTSHSWRPIMMMMTQHRPQTTKPIFTNKHPPYNYHAPRVPFNHEQRSPTNGIISGHGQMSGHLAHQLALYQHQQQQHQNNFPYPAAAETFHQNYDHASNDGQYHGLSSYQVPIHH